MLRFPRARPETTLDILERNLALWPELAPPEVRESRTPTVQDILPIVIEDGCGLRPARKGGIRLEVEWFEVARTGRKIPVVFNYGSGNLFPSPVTEAHSAPSHGGSGFQGSWGSADVALKLLEDALKDTLGH